MCDSALPLFNLYLPCQEGLWFEVPLLTSLHSWSSGGFCFPGRKRKSFHREPSNRSARPACVIALQHWLNSAVPSMIAGSGGEKGGWYPPLVVISSCPPCCPRGTHAHLQEVCAGPQSHRGGRGMNLPRNPCQWGQSPTGRNEETPHCSLLPTHPCFCWDITVGIPSAASQSAQDVESGCLSPEPEALPRSHPSAAEPGRHIPHSQAHGYSVMSGDRDQIPKGFLKNCSS